MWQLKDFRDGAEFKLNGWDIDEPFTQVSEIEGLEVFLCGFQASHPQYGELVGSAADLNEYPMLRAWYELIERISIVESMERPNFLLKDIQTGSSTGSVKNEIIFPKMGVIERNGLQETDFQYAKSNAVALFTNWSESCRRACLELVERHLVLSTWVGLTSPTTFSSSSDTFSQLEAIYEVVGVSFGCQSVSCSPEPVVVSGYSLLPKSSSNPLIIGFGAGFSLEDSLKKAESETLQRLGFLWGEEIPDREPEFQPTHLYHQDYYLNPKMRSRIEAWLSGKHAQNIGPKPSKALEIDFADLSNPERPHLFVAKALASAAIPLVFGRWREREFRMVHEDLLIHPIA